MCYASANGQEDVSITDRVIGIMTVASVVLMILMLAGCVTTSGTQATGSGAIYNTATFNINSTGPVLTPMGLRPGVRAAGDGQAVNPGASTQSSEGVSATGTGNIVINFRQGSTETQAPSAVGLNASIPVSSIPYSSGSLLRSSPNR